MAHTTRILVAGIVMVGALVSAKHSEAAKPQENAAAARPPVGPTAAGVRTTSPVLATLIRQASERSATFRALIDTIEASDGIVQVSEGKCRHGARACLPLTVTVAGPFRILFILVRIDTRRADWDYMGSIGHELHHAIEVLSDAQDHGQSRNGAVVHERGKGGEWDLRNRRGSRYGVRSATRGPRGASSGVQVMSGITRLVRGREALGAATPSRASNRA